MIKLKMKKMTDFLFREVDIHSKRKKTYNMPISKPQIIRITLKATV